MSLLLMYLRKYRTRKIWLDKNLESRVAEDPYTDSKEHGSTYCSNLNDSTFTKFIKRFKLSCIGKNLF